MLVRASSSGCPLKVSATGNSEVASRYTSIVLKLWLRVVIEGFFAGAYLNDCRCWTAAPLWVSCPVYKRTTPGSEVAASTERAGKNQPALIQQLCSGQIC